jgi:ketosteroid isomerase-like protein
MSARTHPMSARVIDECRRAGRTRALQRASPADRVRPTPARVSTEIVERFLACRDARDTQGCVALVGEGALWHSPVGPPKRGPAGFAEAIEQAYAGTAWFTTETLGVERDGDAVVARVRNRGERAGEKLDSVQRLVFRVGNGVITDVRIHVDDHAAVAEFWKPHAPE